MTVITAYTNKTLFLPSWKKVMNRRQTIHLDCQWKTLFENYWSLISYRPVFILPVNIDMWSWMQHHVWDTEPQNILYGRSDCKVYTTFITSPLISRDPSTGYGMHHGKQPRGSMTSLRIWFEPFSSCVITLTGPCNEHPGKPHLI